MDLNKLKIPTDTGEVELKDYSLSTKLISVYFRNQKQVLIENIRKADVVLGCIAWLTDYDILKELSFKDSVIVVQKEDFLRPDIDSGTKKIFNKKLSNAYKKLKCDVARFEFDNIMNSLSICTDPGIEPVRCVGNHNSNRVPAFPRMHNKLIIFCSIVDGDHPESSWKKVIPYAVWTGSYNLTKNACASFENAVLINDSDISKAFYQEFGQIMVLSEPLDWKQDWVEPEWRIGT